MLKRLSAALLLGLTLLSADALDVRFGSKRLSPTLEIARDQLAPLSSTARVTVDSRGKRSTGLDGYTITSDSLKGITLKADTDLGALYGACHISRLIASSQPIPARLSETPAYALRLLNHWDNLNGTVERGYAGQSLWNWADLERDIISPRYAEYALRNASVGINGAVINNVNASPKILSAPYLERVKKLADIFRPYGVKVYLSVNFASPMALDSLPTADPLDPAVQKWWREKVNAIYRLIPDFGGFLVKANSEGEPGPMDFGRTHADGANMLARALKPHGGIVMWRAFVYSPIDADRAKQAYMEFDPLDGQFADNVIIQIKNGPVDFQPREPYSPLFDGIPRSKRMAEFQITQEYLGHANHLAFLAPMWEEFFRYVPSSSIKGVAGVANVGNDEVMTGHPLADANWYAFGRLAWNPSLSSATIADEWLSSRLLAPETPSTVRTALRDMLLTSRETVVDYMMPLGLHHIFAWGHHYGPQPWCEVAGARPDWLPRYYHRADTLGLGFDRTSTGSDAVSQYRAPYGALFGSLTECPEEFLLWFHHVPWTHELKSGRTLWGELCHRYSRGAARAARYQNVWAMARPYVDPATHADVERRLITQARDAQWWKDACLLYFQQYSRLPLTPEVYPLHHTLPSLLPVSLGIDNYTNPTPSLLDSLR